MVAPILILWALVAICVVIGLVVSDWDWDEVLAGGFFWPFLLLALVIHGCRKLIRRWT